MEAGDSEAPPKFGLALRLPLIALGVTSIAAAFPLAYVALVFLGGGHGNPFGAAGWSEWLFRAALLGIPLLLVAAGFAAIACSNRRGLRKLALIVALIPAFVLIAFAAAAYSNSAEHERVRSDLCGNLPPSACSVGAPR
ncbi:MAG TPA: hypothetical protein VF662_14260 [Allosphingosinicella sp.]|jgi:hypothetical protein